MTKKNGTKRSLLMSALALVLCLSMLVGSTFAWFTDSVTSSGNKIQAGKLDIELWMDADVDGNYDNISDSTDPIFGTGSIAQNNNAQTLWEPGKTQVAYLMLKNSGSLALKYKVEVKVTNPTDGKDLYKVMKYAIIPDADKNNPVTPWTSGTAVDLGVNVTDAFDVEMAPNAEHYFALAVHMDEAAGNEYQDGKVNFDIIVSATQKDAEADAFGPDYDTDAMYAVADGLYLDNTGDYTATSTAGLTAVSKLASSDDSITSVTYVTDEGEVEVPVVSDFDAFDSAIDNDNEIVVLTNGNFQMPDGSDTLLQGQELTIVGTEDTVIDATAVDANDQFVTGATMVFEGVTLNFGTVNYMGFANTASLVYKDCKINGLQFLYGENVTFENCDLNSNGAEHCVWTYGVKNVSFIDCDFTYGDRGINCYSDNDVPGGKQTVNFTNCTFTTDNTDSDGAVEINSCFFSVGIEVNLKNCTAPAYGEMAYVSPWDSTNGAKTTINIQ